MADINEIPDNGYRHTGKPCQSQVGWWHLPIEVVATDISKQWFRRVMYINTNVRSKLPSPKITSELISKCGVKALSMLQHQISEEGRADEAMIEQETIAAATEKKIKILNGTAQNPNGIRLEGD